MFRNTPARLGLGTAATVAGLVLLAPTAAHAEIIGLPGGGPVTLPPGQSVCVGGKALSDAKGVGTADNPGVVYIMSRNGTEIFRTPTRRTGYFETPVFVDPGNYLFCAKNPAGLGQSVTNVNIWLLTDGDA